MTSFEIGRIRCTSCGRFINRKLAPYKKLLSMGYSRMQAFEALNVKGYCCRAQLEQPDVITLDDPYMLASRDTIDPRTGRIVSKAIDPESLIDTGSLEDDITIDNLPSIIAGEIISETFRLTRATPEILVSNEQIERVKRERKKTKVSTGGPTYNIITGKREEEKVLPVMIRPISKGVEPPVVVSKGRARGGTRVARGGTTVARGGTRKAPGSYFAPKQRRPIRRAFRNIEEEEEEPREGEVIRDAKTIRIITKEGLQPAFNISNKVAIITLEEGEKVPAGYTEADIQMPTMIEDAPEGARLVKKY